MKRWNEYSKSHKKKKYLGERLTSLNQNRFMKAALHKLTIYTQRQKEVKLILSKLKNKTRMVVKQKIFRLLKKLMNRNALAIKFIS